MQRLAPIAIVASLLALAAGAARGAEPTPPAPSRSAAESFVLGRMLLLERSFGDAIGLLEQAAAAAPTDPYPHLELAKACLRVGRAEQAAHEAQQALALAPGDPDVLRGGADTLLAVSEGNPMLLAQARAALEKLLFLEPDDPGALGSLVNLHFAAGDEAKAEEMLRRLVSAVPDSRPAANELLRLMLKRGEKADAAALLRDQLDRDPEDVDLRARLADFLSDSGDHAGAVALLRGAPAEQADEPDLQRRLAFELYRTGDTAAAIALVEKLLAEGPDPRLRLFHALLLEQEGKDDAALRELETLHGELPSDPEVGLSLARLLAHGGKRQEARALLEELIAKLERGGVEGKLAADRARLELAQLLAEQERWAEVLLGLGRDREAVAELAKLPAGPEGKGRAAEVYQRAGRHAEAIPLLEALVADDPASPELRFRLGAAYERTGKLAQATETFQELLRRTPDNPMALNYLGYMWADKGENLDEALGLIRRAIELDPDNAAYIDSLGWAYYRLGDFPQALTQLQKAAMLLPTDPTVQEHLGDALRALGKREEARTAYQRALALGEAEGSQVKRKLEEVERDLHRQ